jgi:hypothetical protein
MEATRLQTKHSILKAKAKGGCTLAHWIDKILHTRVNLRCCCIFRTQDNRELRKQNRRPYIKKKMPMHVHAHAHAHNYNLQLLMDDG